MFNCPILQRPLNPDEIEKFLNEENYITAIVPLKLTTIINVDGMDEFNNAIEEKLLKEGIMSDITYHTVGVLNDMILIQVHCQVEFV